MATIPQLIQQIRFQLSQLSASNSHHEFEHLCRHLARLTICSNILPSTGPVGAGGDQGRDFETFRTHHSLNDGPTSLFLGRAVEGTIAFACTLQETALESKIKSDVGKIVASGQQVGSVHVFLGHGLPVAKRHDLQAWARDQHAITLEIHDAEAIAERLSERELFWIAEQFLKVPRELYPPPPAENTDQWYSDALGDWSRSNEFDPTYANFFDLKGALRHATFEEQHHPDLSLWIARMGRFCQPDAPADLQRKAQYEIAVASLRGQGTLIGREAELREWFAGIPAMQATSELEDASNLLTYCTGAHHANAVDLTATELKCYQNALADRVDALLKKLTSDNTRCHLLEIRGHIALLLTADFTDQRKPDPHAAIAWWLKLCEHVGSAPLFPLEQFADRLTNCIEVIGDDPAFSSLTRSVDKLLTDRTGAFAAADKCRDRAIRLYRSGRINRAISELHNAKVAWFADETLRGAMLAMLLLAEWYRELGLSYAAKQYALAVAYMAIRSSKVDIRRYLSVALVHVGECDYLQGCWLDFLGAMELAMTSHKFVPGRGEERRREEEFQRVMFHTTIVLALAERWDKDLFDRLEDRVRRWGVGEWIDGLLPTARKVWGNLSDKELWDELENQLKGRPFGDLGHQRVITWRQLGVQWSVRWRNKHAITAVGEQLVAALQILLTDLAGKDLCLLQTRVSIEVDVVTGQSSALDWRPSNEGRVWRVRVSAEDPQSPDDLGETTISHIAAILADVSLLPTEEFMKRLHGAFEAGLTHKIMTAQTYSEMYRDLVGEVFFREADRPQFAQPAAHQTFVVKEHSELRWFDAPGPGYDVQKAREANINRYKHAIRPVRYTTIRLWNEKSFRETVGRLRGSGWKDWHLLMAIAGITVNYRLSRELAHNHERAVHEQRFREMMYSDESESADVIPVDEFKDDKLRAALRISQLSTLANLGLTCRQATPDFEGIEKFLGTRYSYWTDDIPHENLFSDDALS